MQNCPDIPNPRKNAAGTSQQRRLVDAVMPDSIRIDAHTLADRLSFIAGFARQVNYFDAQLNVDNWSAFFENSAPFILARLIQTDLDHLSDTLLRFTEKAQSQPEAEHIRFLFDFVVNELFEAINDDHQTLSRRPNVFTLHWGQNIRSILRQPLLGIIARNNCLSAHPEIGPKLPIHHYDAFIKNDIWGLQIQDLYVSSCTGLVPEKEYLIKKTATELYQFGRNAIEVLRATIAEAPDWLQDSLEPLKEEFRQLHEPHLGLLFAFLKLFEQFSDDLNALGKEHLEYFFKDVLNLKPKAAVPDHAHLVLEVQKHIDRYRLKKGTVVKDGKDGKNADVFFALDEEIVVDKAKVERLLTLFLNPVDAACQQGADIVRVPYTEGVYIAPVAHSADGKGEAFDEASTKNWSTLGSKPSKLIPKNELIARNHPNGRMGFVFASPVLYLQEGTRKITFTINCKGDAGDSGSICFSEKNERIFDKLFPVFNNFYYVITEESINAAKKDGLSASAIEAASRWLKKKNPYTTWGNNEPCPEAGTECVTDTNLYETCTGAYAKTAFALISSLNASDSAILIKHTRRKIFKLWLSGENNWLPVPLDEPGYTFSITPSSSNFTAFDLTIVAEVPPEFPPVTFFNPEILKEDLQAEMPAAKFELDPDIKIWCPNAKGDPDCCFESPLKDNGIYVSLYQLFSNVQITGCTIDVQVCGVRNLVVQNDESLQDVNGLIRPFGSRPKVDSNFYIGSKEVFGKNWQNVWLNIKWKDRPQNFTTYYERYEYEPFEDGSSTITDASFLIRPNLLENFKWLGGPPDKQLFTEDIYAAFCDPFEIPAEDFKTNGFLFQRSSFAGSTYEPFSLDNIPVTELNVNSKDNFLRLTLKGVSFQHDRYTFVLARQMFKLAGLADLFSFPPFIQKIIDAENRADDLKNKVDNSLMPDITADELNADTLSTATKEDVRGQFNPLFPFNLLQEGVKQISDDLESRLDTILTDINNINAPDPTPKIPNEPYTPVISEISINYTATANLQDQSFIHLYPYENTHKTEPLPTQPTLIPRFPEEGALFIGLKDLIPGSNLFLLFQLAESTADTEAEPAEVVWHYLRNNEWRPLRTGFEIISDETKDLTKSGIVKIAVPADITRGPENSILPHEKDVAKNLHWLKVGAPANTRAVCETLGIHTQAVRGTFTLLPENDTARLASPLPAGQLAKLREADASVKLVSQPYESFGGKPPEADSLFYVRATERLRHKGRAINVFDYERLTLQMFPEIFKAKCIPHTMGLGARRYKTDVEWAAGFVTVVVIPDLRRMKAGENLYPRAPLSLLDDIRDYLCGRSSTFARLRVMNPRYEGVNVRIQVRFAKGVDENYYRTQLRTDIIHFLAPWWTGDTDKLRFGQPLYFSDLLKFVECLEYVDFVTRLEFWHEEDVPGVEKVIEPKTARSILAPGVITVCDPDPLVCPAYDDIEPPACNPCTTQDPRPAKKEKDIYCGNADDLETEESHLMNT